MKAAHAAEPVHGLLFGIAFSVLVSAMFALIAAILIQMLLHVARVLRPLAWTVVTVAAEVAFREMVKWLLLARGGIYWPPPVSAIAIPCRALGLKVRARRLKAAAVGPPVLPAFAGEGDKPPRA